MFINTQHPRNRGLLYWLYPMPSQWNGSEWFGPRGKATITGTPVRGINYLDLDGSTNYLTITKPVWSNPFNVFTIIIDVNIDVSGSLDTLITKGQVANPYANFEIRRNSGLDQWQGLIGISTTSYTVDTPAFTVGTRHTVAFSYDGETMSIYLNGRNKATNTTPSGNPIDTASDIVIGENTSFTGRLIDGKLYSVKIFDRCLADDDIDLDYHDSLKNYPGYFAPENDMDFCLRLRKKPSNSNFIIF